MKFNIKFILPFLIMIGAVVDCNGQEALDLEAIRLSMSTKGNMDSDTVDMLIGIVKEKLTEYNELGTFYDEADNSFSINKSIEFGELFDQFATIYHDIQSTKYAKKNVDLNTYVDDAYTYLKDMGIKYTISDVRIKTIDTDASGYYVVDVNLNKNMLVMIDDGEGRLLDEPRVINLDFRVELPPDYLEGAKFSFVRGKQKTVVKAKKEKLFHLALGGYYNYGIVNSSSPTSANVSHAGINLALRHNLLGKNNLFLVARGYVNALDAKYVSKSSENIPYTEIASESLDKNVVYYSSGTPGPQQTTNVSYYYNEATSIEEIMSTKPFGFFGADLGIGFSPKSSSTRSRFIVDITGGIAIRGKMENVESNLKGLKGVIIPSRGVHGWPDVSEQDVLFNSDYSNLLEVIESDERYHWEGADERIDQNDIAASNFYNLTLSPTFQKYFSDRLGFEFGADLYYNFAGSPFKGLDGGLVSNDVSYLKGNSNFKELGARLKLSIVWNMKKNWY